MFPKRKQQPRKDEFLKVIAGLEYRPPDFSLLFIAGKMLFAVESVGFPFWSPAQG